MQILCTVVHGIVQYYLDCHCCSHLLLYEVTMKRVYSYSAFSTGLLTFIIYCFRAPKKDFGKTVTATNQEMKAHTTKIALNWMHTSPASSKYLYQR